MTNEIQQIRNSNDTSGLLFLVVSANFLKKKTNLTECAKVYDNVTGILGREISTCGTDLAFKIVRACINVWNH